MNGLPAEMIDRWQDRAEPAPGEGLIYWHMLVGTDPDVIALAQEARRKLAPFTGLHLTPYAWLHMTALIAGEASEITGRADPADGRGRRPTAGRCSAAHRDGRKGPLPPRSDHARRPASRGPTASTGGGPGGDTGR